MQKLQKLFPKAHLPPEGGFLRNHPFVDGNKRTAFMAAYVFLARNGRRLSAPEDAATYAMMALAEGSMDEDAFAAWLREHSA